MDKATEDRLGVEGGASPLLMHVVSGPGRPSKRMTVTLEPDCNMAGRDPVVGLTGFVTPEGELTCQL